MDVGDGDTLLLKCKPCPGRETHPRLAPEEWLPYCVHHKAHPYVRNPLGKDKHNGGQQGAYGV